MSLRNCVILFQLSGAAALSSGCFSTGGTPTGSGKPASSEASARCVVVDDADRATDQVLQLLNLERAERNLQPVVVNERLTAIATDYACHMIEEGFFSHRDPVTGHGPAERAVAGKYAFFSIGENLAAGVKTPPEVMDLWMASDSHRLIVVDPSWKEVGIGIRAGGEFGTYWVLEFGDPAGL